MKEGHQEATDHLFAILYVCLLLGSASFVPSLWRFLERHLPGHHLLPQGFFVMSALILIRSLPRKPLRVLIFLTLVGGFLSSMMLLKRPVEQIHFLEYGILSYFLFRVFRHHVKIPWCFSLSVLGAFGVGVLDEWLQGLLPNRVYDVRDIWINLWAATLGMVIFACVLTQST